MLPAAAAAAAAEDDHLLTSGIKRSHSYRECATLPLYDKTPPQG